MSSKLSSSDCSNLDGKIGGNETALAGTLGRLEREIESLASTLCLLERGSSNFAHSLPESGMPNTFLPKLTAGIAASFRHIKAASGWC